MKAMRKTTLLCLAAAASAAGPAAAGTVTVGARDCDRLLSEHVPAPDVAFQPGHGVRGKRVAPADYGGGYPRIEAPAEIAFDVRVDLRTFLGGPAADAAAASAAVAASDRAAAAQEASADAFAEAARIGRFLGEPVVGRVTLRGHEVYFNGELIGDAARAAIAEECRALRERGR